MWCTHATWSTHAPQPICCFNAKNMGVSKIPLLYAVQSDYAPLYASQR